MSRVPWQSLLNPAAAAVLLWQGGPLLLIGDWRPFDSPFARAGLLLVGALLWLAVRAGRAWRARRRNAALLGDLQAARRHTDELLAQRFSQAIAVLRTGVAAAPAGRWRRARRRHLAQLPWYLFIGAPGAGKTTALLHSGLRFPLAGQLGHGPVAGIGGTRHCDWWFTDQAVFIDTAGRYTTQDSDAGADAHEWHTFLRLLRRHRPAQPINGVIVTVSVPDLLDGGPPLDQQARAVDARLQELRQQLGQSFPVYVLVTKADLLAGFGEFFGHLDAAGREQVWGLGWGAGGARGDGAVAAAFDAGQVGVRLADLLARLEPLTRERLQREPSVQRRATIHRFASQVALLAQPLQAFLAQALRQAAAAPGQTVRGVFLTSGTQEGNPIDRVMGALARGFGVAVRPLSRPDGAGKAYFLTRLLRDHVVGEAALAGTRLQRERGLRRLEQGAAALTGLALLGLCLLWAWTARGDAQALAALRQRVDGVSRQVQGAPAAAVDRLLPLYAALRGLAGPDETATSRRGWGLSQQARLAQTAEQTYRHVLDRSLAPLLAQRLTAVLADTARPAADRHDALRIHAMLMQPQHLDRAEVRAWAAREFALDPTGAGIAPGERQEWLTHLEALLQRNAVLEAARVDANVLQAARTGLARVPLAERTYARLLRAAGDVLAPGTAALDLAGLAGPQATRLLGPRAPAPALPALPAVFTAAGWREGVAPLLQRTARRAVDEEHWVLAQPADADADALAAQLLQRYAQEYAARWGAWLQALGPTLPADPEQALRASGVLAAPDGPLRRLLAGLRRQLQPAADGLEAPLAQAMSQSLALRFGALLAPPDSAGVDGPGALLDAVAAAAPTGAGPPPVARADALAVALARLRRAAESAPAPLSGWWGDWARQLARAQASVPGDPPWGDGLAVLARECQALVAGRFPFDARAASDMPLADFARLFGPEGLIEQFVRRHVDTAAQPWRWRTTDDHSPRGTRALEALAQAGRVRAAFFGPGGSAPELRVELVPVDLDPALFWFQLDVDGQTLRYENGPRRPKTVVWPSAGGAGKVLLRVPRPDSGDTATEIREGPWALWRVLTREPWQRSAASPERALVHLAVEGHGLGLELRAGPDTWLLPQLGRFTCPAP